MSSLAEALKSWHDRITKYLYLGNVRWDKLLARVEEEERNPSDSFADEQVWTFLVASGYAAAKEAGVVSLGEHLTCSRQTGPTNPRIWLEFEAFPPRKKEGGTHLDLTVGTIGIRPGTKGRIELDDVESSWVCFCEMKWYSDISSGVSYDINRNQLARVIENAVCFQRDGTYAERVYVTLVTPSIFRQSCVKSRLYQYKYEDYGTNRDRLLDDLEGSALDENASSNWVYPSNLAKRVEQHLSLRWTIYDDLFADLPDSGIRPELTAFWARHGNYQGRPPLRKEP